MSNDITTLAAKLKAAEKLVAEQRDIIKKQEKWIKDVEETMIAATDRAETAEKRIAELEVEAAELIRFKEVMISASEALKEGDPLNLESLFKGELASAMFAMMFAGEFKRSGATNYLELVYDVPDFGLVNVTIQKVDGKTPGQRIAELEQSHAEVLHSRDHYKRIVDEGLAKLAEARTLTVKLPDYRGTYKETFASEVEHHVRSQLEKLAAAAGIKLQIEGD